MIKIKLPDGSLKEFQKAPSALDVAKSISEGLARVSIAAKVNGELTDLSTILKDKDSVEIITTKSKESLDILRHTTAHVFAQALMRLYPKAKVTIGPAIENGFFYDVDQDLTDDSLPKIEEEMKKIIKEDLAITVSLKSKDEAIKFFKDNKYKKEIVEAIFSNSLKAEEKEEGRLSGDKLKFYKQGDFEDLCTGPHLPKTGMIGAFKLERVTKAYWRADAKNKQLSRVYGSAFWKKSELDAHYSMLDEAKKRDHRIIGKQMNLFMIHEYAPGMTFFLPKGFTIYKLLQDFIREKYVELGYTEVMTPNMFNKKLWETSGHWEHYKDDMFVLTSEGQEFSLKPMNCPSHCLIYKNDFKSYKDLPIRLADFGALHRNELSGALSGLTRVRKFCQDDAHIFCTHDQIVDEIDKQLKFVEYVYKDIFKMEYAVAIGTRPKTSLGSDAVWKKAEAALKEALKKNKIEFGINEGDGAFYGPKIDFRIKDSLGRTWQTATLQLDFNLPERFDLKYETSDSKQERPVMIHRAVLGSLERFIALIIEHYAGKFPLWLSPVQVKILNIADRHIEECDKIKRELEKEGFRVEANYDHLTMGNKIRMAQEEKINYIIVIGDDDIKNKTVSIRDRNNEQKNYSLKDFMKLLKEEREHRR